MKIKNQKLKIKNMTYVAGTLSRSAARGASGHGSTRLWRGESERRKPAKILAGDLSGSLETKFPRNPEIRFLNEMRPVLYDQKWFKSVKNPEKIDVYYVYRRLKRKKNLRYDITVIPSKMLGREFPKTKGHSHSNVQELVWVLEGKALYFAQKSKGNYVEDCYVIEAKKGDLLIIPIGYDHLTINPSKNKLIMANWISEKAKYNYSLFDHFQGACYYYTKKGWIKNKNYKTIPKLRFQKPLKSMPRDLGFLK